MDFFATCCFLVFGIWRINFNEIAIFEFLDSFLAIVAKFYWNVRVPFVQ